jgi:PAS domain S-box-containing protein
MVGGKADGDTEVQLKATQEVTTPRSEPVFQSLMEAMSQGIVLHDASGKISYANPAAARILGVSLDQMLGLDSLDPRWHAVHEDKTPYSGETHPAMEVLRTGQEVRGAIMGVFNPHYSAYRWIEIDAIPQYDAGQDALSRIMVIFVDISDRWEAQAGLRETLARLKRSQEIAMVGDWSWDLALDRFTASEQALRLMGFPPGSLPSFQDVVETMVPEDRPRARDHLQEALRTGRPYAVEIRIQKLDTGELRHLISMGTVEMDDQKRPLRVIGVNQDITDRKSTEEALTESERRLTRVFDAVNDAYWDWHVPSGKAYFSPRYYTMLGYDVDEFPGGFESWMALMHPDDRELAQTEVMNHIEMKAEGYAVDFRMRTKSGEYRWILGRGQVVERDESGQVLRMVGSHTDISDRKATEEALRQSEEKYRLIFDYSPVGLLSFDEEGRILACNDRFVKIIGSTREKLIGLCMLRLPNEKVAAAVQKSLDGENGLYEGDYRSFTADKTTSLRALFAPAVKGGVRSGGIGIIEDVSERMKAETARKEIEKRFRELVELAVDGILIGDQDGLIIGANQAFCHMVGLDEAAVLGKHVRELPFDSEDIRQTPFRFDLLQRGEIVENQRALIRPDGSRVLVEMRSKMMPDRSYQSIFRDISERKRAEAALVESTELFALFMHHSPIYTFIKSVIPEESRVLQASDNFVEMIGISGQEMQGKTMTELFPPEFAAKITADDWAVVAEGRVLKLDEELNGRSYTTIKFPIVKGDRTLLAGYTIDITERRTAEQERAKLQEQLMQAQKMESVGRLAGGVAHDFNNMLGVILGYTDMGLNKIAEDHVLAKYLREIRKAAERSSNLTRQLLAFARKQTVTPRVLDLNGTVEGMLAMLERLIGEDIKLAWIPGKGVWPVRIDPTQVDQILANLCVNARDAISGNGRITIETDNRFIDEACCVLNSEARVGAYVSLTVSDDGCGMDQETKSHLFEPFFTTKELGRGTGLGLATIYGVVKQNEGFLSVYSEPGQGTSIKIYLPRYQARTDEQKAVETMGEFIGGQGTLLLVEDEPAILEMTGLMLGELGYTVLMADTPGKALETAQQHPGQIDLLVTDVIMPEMNGRELARSLLSLYPGMKRLFMSGYTADVIAHHGVLDPGVHFIQKPFTVENLASKVAEVLDGD